MKRIWTLALVSLGAVTLFGCPVYSGGGSEVGPNCYCPYGTPDCCGVSPPNNNTCASPLDCPAGENCGIDDQCHGGDCSTSGCPSGYTCTLEGGEAPVCIATGSSPDGGTGFDASVSDSGPSGDVSSPPDAGDSGGFSGCTSDNACALLGAGAKCLDGACVAPADQCFDATQCPNNEQCVQGVCTPGCTSQTCPEGYSCDMARGVCTGNPMPCGGGDAGSCASNLTCVDQRCVDPCGPGGTCTNGLICVDGGCIPDQKPNFVCTTEGQQDDCVAGSICLHHNCYIACAPDGGADACKTADQFNVCKQVMTSTGTYPVCGSATNLGNQCNPQGQACASPAICIDGFCR